MSHSKNSQKRMYNIIFFNVALQKLSGLL
jgi:hypothetical protein